MNTTTATPTARDIETARILGTTVEEQTRLRLAHDALERARQARMTPADRDRDLARCLSAWRLQHGAR